MELPNQFFKGIDEKGFKRAAEEICKVISKSVCQISKWIVWQIPNGISYEVFKQTDCCSGDLWSNYWMNCRKNFPMLFRRNSQYIN